MKLLLRSKLIQNIKERCKLLQKSESYLSHFGPRLGPITFIGVQKKLLDWTLSTKLSEYRSIHYIQSLIIWETKILILDDFQKIHADFKAFISYSTSCRSSKPKDVCFIIMDLISNNCHLCGLRFLNWHITWTYVTSQILVTSSYSTKMIIYALRADWLGLEHW